MLSRTSAGFLCCLTLLAGVLIGSRTDLLWQGRAAHARALEPGELNRQYDELQAKNALLEANALLAKISRLTSPSVVHIQSERHVPRRGLIEETGSGVIMDSPRVSGLYVVTNGHVVAGADLSNISVNLHDGRVLHPVQKWTDPPTDVAVLKLGTDVPDLQAARWGDSDKLQIGNMVLAMGSPFGLDQSVTLGIISAKGRRSLELGDGSGVLNKDFLQTDAAINPGNSGGPLIDLQGQVIGINTAIASNSGGNEGIGFSIPSNLARTVMEQLLTNGKVLRAYLGVKLDPHFGEESARRLKLDRVRGARVTGVEQNSPAARANLQLDDVILTFDGIEVHDENHLINLVSLAPVNKEKKVKVVIFRAGKHVTLDVILIDRPEDRKQSSLPSKPGMGVQVGALGLTLHDLDPDLAQQLGYSKTTRGLLVLNVDPLGPSASEVQVYDLIEEVARTPVRSVQELESILERKDTREHLAFKLARKQQGKVDNRVVVVNRK